jgi:hypothetical protein
MHNVGMPELVLIIMVIVFFVFTISALYIVAIWRILKRVGHNPMWSLIALLPGGKLIGLYIFAFTKWPIKDAMEKQV